MQIVQRTAQRQSIVMTGHMQQAIALLQLSNTDLQAFIEKEAEENPFIDLDRCRAAVPDLPMSRGMGEDMGDAVGRIADHPMSLYAHIAAQFDLMFDALQERAIADRFLEAIDGNGWLSEPLDQIAFDCAITMEQAEMMLERVQQVEPAGLFARNLADCLRLQAVDQGILTEVFACVLDHLPRLAAADLTGLARICGCDMATLRATLVQLRGLNPKPGADFTMADLRQREPDLIVVEKKCQDGVTWQVELNRSTLPSVTITAPDGLATAHTGSAHSFVTERLGVARWLARAVAHRNQTMLAVGAEILRRQAGFLSGGPSQIVPMTLADVAASVGVHESTVSRVTSSAMIATPQGTFTLKRFFSSALASTGDGDAASAAAVRHQLQQLVAAENPAAPLSDDAIARAIKVNGVVLARRTVAKYRDMLNIPSSFQRKRQAKLKAG